MPSTVMMPNVAYTRNEVKFYLPHYSLIDDVLAGARMIKAKGEKYLPRPNPTDTSDENKKRYEQYVSRAVFYNVSRRTLGGLVGEIFARDPVYELPAGLETMIDDADGGGLSLTQMLKRASRRTLAKGRAGVLIDYPQIDGGASRADIDSGIARPTLELFNADKIINWRKQRIGAKVYLTLVVLQYEEIISDDGFEAQKTKAYRVLRLRGDKYTSQKFVQTSKTSPLAALPEITPLDASGRPFDEIPFEFIGSEDNDPEPDYPPMYDICDLNIAHYRNSADYEESSFLVGQPTLVLSGLTEEWVSNVLQGKVMLGSRAAIPLPPDASADLVQADPNTLPKEGMEHKELQMVALGAKLVEQRNVQRTAFETGVDSAADNSILASVTNNVQAAFRAALVWAGRFSGDEIGDPVSALQMNTEFHLTRLSPQDQAAVISAWKDEAITYSEMRAQLRKTNIATLSDEDARKENANDETLAMKRAIESVKLNEPEDDEPTDD